MIDQPASNRRRIGDGDENDLGRIYDPAFSQVRQLLAHGVKSEKALAGTNFLQHRFRVDARIPYDRSEGYPQGSCHRLDSWRLFRFRLCGFERGFQQRGRSNQRAPAARQDPARAGRPDCFQGVFGEDRLGSDLALGGAADVNYRHFFDLHSQRDYHDISSAVAAAAVKTAYCAGAKVIFAFTTSGMTARLLSRLRPEMLIIAVTPSEPVYHQMVLNWGVVPLLLPKWKDAKHAFDAASAFSLKKGLISFGDVVVVTSGVSFGKKGTTNMMVVESIGDVLVRGHKGFGPKISGKISIILSPEGRTPEQFKDKIVVILHCDNAFLEVLKQAAGIILQNYVGDSGSEKYGEMVAKTLNISVMCRADGAMHLLNEGEAAYA